jgi:hypothetical protein
MFYTYLYILYVKPPVKYHCVHLEMNSSLLNDCENFERAIIPFLWLLSNQMFYKNVFRITFWVLETSFEDPLKDPR